MSQICKLNPTYRLFLARKILTGSKSRTKDNESDSPSDSVHNALLSVPHYIYGLTFPRCATTKKLHWFFHQWRDGIAHACDITLTPASITPNLIHATNHERFGSPCVGSAKPASFWVQSLLLKPDSLRVDRIPFYNSRVQIPIHPIMTNARPGSLLPRLHAL